MPCQGRHGRHHDGKKLSVKDLTNPKVVADIKDDEALRNLKEGVKDKNGKEIKKPFASKLTEVEMKALIEYSKAFAKK